MPSGLGNVIAQSASTGSTADAYAAIVLTGIVGVLLNVLVGVAQRRLSRWHYHAQGAAS